MQETRLRLDAVNLRAGRKSRMGELSEIHMGREVGLTGLT